MRTDCISKTNLKCYGYLHNRDIFRSVIGCCFLMSHVTNNDKEKLKKKDKVCIDQISPCNTCYCLLGEDKNIR